MVSRTTSTGSALELDACLEVVSITRYTTPTILQDVGRAVARQQSVLTLGCYLLGPYVTSVGQTRLYDSQAIRDRESAGSVNVTAIALETGYGSIDNPSDDLFGSGGGFSNYFARPGYQSAAVANYLSRHSPGVPSYVANADASNIGEGGGLFNRAGRGYPDVAGKYIFSFRGMT